ncbi:MAG TPA: FliM/FliN family flagellar motor switch protein [Sedimentisphaerales bacterium]|nr:FliM/FliN family flagellar motor switch protein [Sedimentisphaerales bacterium]
MAQTAKAEEKKTEEKQDQENSTPQADSKTQVQSVELSEAAETAAAGPGGSIDILLDMNVPVTAAIGRTEIPVRRLLQLGPGSVLKLDKPVDAPADLYLRDTKFAAGNIVVVDGRFAVRIKQILGLDRAEPGDSDTNTAEG